MFIPVIWRTVLASVIVAETVSRFQRSNGHDPDYSAGPPVRLHYTHGYYQSERMDSKPHHGIFERLQYGIFERLQFVAIQTILGLSLVVCLIRSMVPTIAVVNRFSRVNE